jgi:hypothetical protein
MDAGEIALVGAVAAVVGAGLGALGAWGAAQTNGRSTRQAQHEQRVWQQRHDAYAAFTDATTEYVSAVRAAQEHYHEHQPPSARLRELLDQAMTLQLPMEKAVERVNVAGPPDVATAASEAASWYRSWAESLLGVGRVIVSPPRVPPPSPHPLPSGEFLYRWMAGERSYGLFRALASRVLDSANSYH